MSRFKLIFLLLVFISLAGLRCAAFHPQPIFVSRATKKVGEKKKTQVKKEKVKEEKLTQQEPVSTANSKSPTNSKVPQPVSFEFRQAVMQAIDDYLGTPYRWGGEDSRGMDCSGFVRVVFKRAAGLGLPHNVAQLAKMGKKVPLQNLQFGDLIFFRKSGSGQLFHVGIYLGDGNFAHASTQNGVTISKLTEAYYKNRVAFGRRIK